jgi:hypothetical protein
MPSEGSVFDGFTSIVAQDAATHPSYLPEFYVAESVNRTFRGGINRTRPAIRWLELYPGDGQSSTIVNDIQNGNFQGSYTYRATNYNTHDGLMISVSGKIYFIKIINNFGYAYLLPGIEDSSKSFNGWNDPSLMHTWFVQAEDRVYIQNGNQNAIAWGGGFGNTDVSKLIIGESYEIASIGTTDFTLLGAASNTVGEKFIATASGAGTGEAKAIAYRLNPYLNKMPIGTLMEYAFGRVFVSDKFNQIYASDIIYGNGFTNTLNTENFTEITYWAEGGAFSTPSTMGNITAIKVMPYIGANLRGQGELVVLTESGAFSMDVGLPRTSWNSTQVQRISLLGRGCTSPYVGLANSELWFRSHDGWAFYSNSQSEFGRYFSMRKLSREVNKWVGRDTPWLKQFASTMFFDNYLISTVAPETKRTDAQGLHRYHRGMVVLDLDNSSSPSPDADLSFRWNGVWAGVRPTQCLSAQINNEKRGFIWSFDEDNQNRLYEITANHQDDYGPQGTVPIKSFFITGRYDFNRSGATNKFQRKKITGGEMWMSEIPGVVSSQVEYRSDSTPCWSELKVPTTYGCDPCSPQVDACTPLRGGNRYKRYKFTTPDSSICNDIAGIPAVEGSEFQLKVNLEGTATVDRVRIMANIKDGAQNTVGDCPEDDEECSRFLCCQERYYDYSISNG